MASVNKSFQRDPLGQLKLHHEQLVLTADGRQYRLGQDARVFQMGSEGVWGSREGERPAKIRNVSADGPELHGEITIVQA
jgi:hypothetical protein